MIRLACCTAFFALACVAIAGSSVAAHRYAASATTETAKRMREIYLHTDSRNGKPSYAWLFDLLIPAVLFGLAAGLLLWRWPRLLFAAWLLVTLLVLVLRAINQQYIPYPVPSWMNFHSRWEAALFWLANFFWTSMLSGVFAYIGWGFHHPNADPASVRLWRRKDH